MFNFLSSYIKLCSRTDTNRVQGDILQLIIDLVRLSFRPLRRFAQWKIQADYEKARDSVKATPELVMFLPSPLLNEALSYSGHATAPEEFARRQTLRTCATRIPSTISSR